MQYSHTPRRLTDVQPTAAGVALIALIVAKAADVATTIVMLETGAGVEANPISRAVIETFGLYAGLSVKAAVGILVAVAVFEALSRFSGLAYLKVIGYSTVAAIFVLGAAQNAFILLMDSDLFILGVVA